MNDNKIKYDEYYNEIYDCVLYWNTYLINETT